MAILFKPTGSLDVSTDSSTIPDEGMQRCKNLSLNRSGLLKTRDGYSVLEQTVSFNLNTFTEVDVPSNKVVVAESTLNFSDINTYYDDIYIYKEFDSSVYGGDYDISFDLKITGADAGAILYLFGLTKEVNNLGTLVFSKTLHDIYTYGGASTYLLQIEEVILGEQYGATGITLTYGTTYYIKVKRVESEETYGKLYLYVFSDAARTIPVSGSPRTITLKEKTDFKYLYALSSAYAGVSDKETSGIISNYGSTAVYSFPIYDIVEPIASGEKYVFAGTEIVADTGIIKSGLTSAQWSTIQYNQYNSPVEAIFGLNGTDRKRVEGISVFEWGAEPPTYRPSLSVGSTTGLTGDYNAKYTYARKIDGTVVLETNPSNAPGEAVTLSNESLVLTLTAPTDEQITHYRIYRTLTGGSLYYHDIDIQHIGGAYSYCYDWEREGEYISGIGYSPFTNDSYYKTVDCFTWEIYCEQETIYYLPYVGTSAAENTNILESAEVNVGDLSLGSEVATDHNRPPLGSFVFGPNYNGTCFILKDNLLYYSKPKQPEYWPSDYFIEISPIQHPLTCGTFYNGQPYVSSSNEIYEIQGTGHNTFFPFKTQAGTGTKSCRGLLAVHGQGLFHIGTDGIYVYAGGFDKKITQKGFETIFRGIDSNGVLGVNDTEKSWLVQFRNKIYFFYPDDSETYPSNVLVLDTENSRITHYKYPVELSAVSVEPGGDRILAGDEDGYVIHIEDKDETTDGGSVISWETQSKDFTLQTRAHFPRWAKYDVDASNVSCVATGELIMDGTSHQSHTITGDRTTKRRLVATGNGRRLSVKISGTGPVEIYAAEGE